MRKIPTIISLSTLLFTIGCSAPPLKYYTFSQHNPVQTTLVYNYSNQAPIIYITRVTIPDYLDTADIITRDKTTINHSTNGRMSSILSVGITDYITNNLSDKNPTLFITHQTPIEPASYQLMINISRLDLQNIGNNIGDITLEATWSIIPENEKSPVQKQKFVFSAQGPIHTDNDIIELEQNVITQLTNTINQSINQLHLS